MGLMAANVAACRTCLRLQVVVCGHAPSAAFAAGYRSGRVR